MSIAISQLVTGVPNGTIEFPATDPLNTSSSVNGTTFKYILTDVLEFILRAEGFTTYASCVVATVADLTATYANGTAGVGATLTNAGIQAALSIDGVALISGNRVLVKDQTNTFENGIYVVSNVGSATTNWVLTRADDYNQASEISYLGVVAITRGTTNAGLVFQESSSGPFVIGTSPITFTQLSLTYSLLPSATPANKMLRSDGTYWVQSTNSALSSTDALTGLSELVVDNIQINGNTISSVDLGGNVVITPNTVGSIVLDGLSWPQVDGTNGQAITTNGAGQLGWTSFGAPYTPAALTEVNDTNVTMTLGGTPATALLQAVSMTLGWTGQLGISRGGTNASTIGANGTLAQSDGTKYTFTTATYPSTATATGTILRADGTNWVATTATYPNTTNINHILYSSAANVIGEIADTVGGVLVSNNTGVPSMLANPSDNYRVLQSKNAAIPEWSVAAYPHTAGASGTLMQSDGTDWTNTQATYPGSTNKNHILYSSANNTVGEISTQKNAVLVSDNQSTPQWSGSLSDGQIIIGKTNDLPAAANLTAGTGISITNGNNSITITNTAPSTVTPAAMTRVDDTNVTLTLGGTPATSLLQAVSLTLGWTGQLGVSRGGTGASAVGANGTLAQSDGTKYTFTTAAYPSTATSAGTMLRANGTNWLASTSTFADTYAASSLLYSNGANTVTGLATANSATLVTDATGVPSWTSSMTNGQILIGSTGATPVPATITGTLGITVTNGAGTITISGGGGGYTWTEVTGTTQTMTANNGYITNNPALVTLTLPATAALGTTLSIAGKGAGGWKIAQNAGQEIFFGSSATTIGVTGYLQSTQQFDSIELLCITANTQWTVITGPQGAITVA